MNRYIPKNIKQALIKRANGYCEHCHLPTLIFHIDHIIPVSKGGTNKIYNLKASCPRCNLKKSNKLSWIPTL